MVSDDGTESGQLSTQEYYMVYVEMVSLYDFLKSKTKSEIRLSKSQIVTVDQKTKSVSFRFGDSVANRSRGSMLLLLENCIRESLQKLKSAGFGGHSVLKDLIFCLD